MDFITEARRSFHAALMAGVLKSDSKGIPSNADKHSQPSVKIARGILKRLGPEAEGARLAAQMAGVEFEKICAEYVKQTFSKLKHLRPGSWEVLREIRGGRLGIAQFDQYHHLAALDEAARHNAELATALGSDYLIRPDVVIIRHPEPDETINSQENLVGDKTSRLTSLRKINNNQPILHASISCKWTLRSDRAQNSRSEALNLVRNRKGKLPHIVVVTGEPSPGRIASIAMGTGDIDCVYYFALYELLDTVKELGMEDSHELLQTMIGGKRLRDISDLPLDLAI